MDEVEKEKYVSHFPDHGLCLFLRLTKEAWRRTENRVLSLLDQPAPEGPALWKGALLAAALNDVKRGSRLAYLAQAWHPAATTTNVAAS
jgi:hypothetical protein